MGKAMSSILTVIFCLVITGTAVVSIEAYFTEPEVPEPLINEIKIPPVSGTRRVTAPDQDVPLKPAGLPNYERNYIRLPETDTVSVTGDSR